MANRTRDTANLVSANNLYVDISTDKVGIGTTTPSQKLDVNGGLRLRGALYDGNNQVGAGTSVLLSTGSGIRWTPIATAALQGIQGIQGTQGLQGIQGTQGLLGIQGIQGIQGRQGIQGTQGLQGIQGTQGLLGIQGIQGIQGRQGIQGTQGLQGIQGTQGLQGIQGIQGITGPVAGSANQVVFKDGSNNPTGSANLTFNGSTLEVSGGIIPGSTQGYPNYELLLDFSDNGAGTWRRIVNVTSPNVEYSTIGFKIEITDPKVNHATISSVDNLISETYYVACVRTESTTLNTPNACYVRGPGNRIRATRTATGIYQIHIQNEGQYREYRVNISVYAVNGSHTVTYHAGDGASAGTAQYNASVSTTSTDVFQNLSARTLTSTVATGTAPLTVTSTTKVNNLNADLLDDISSGSFLRSDIADTASGVITFNAIPAFNGGTSGSTAPFTVDSTFVVANLNADLLDGKNSSTTTLGNTIVARTAEGDDNRRYGFGSYFNSSDDVSAGTLTYLMGKFGDNYYRSATAAKVATFISGQTMNISGNASTASAAAGSSFFTQTTASEGQIGALISGQNAVYMYNNTTAWGIYSVSGGSAFQYTRSSGLFNFNGNANTATSATFLNSSNYIQRTGSSGDANTDFQNTPAGSTRLQGDDPTLTNGPGGVWWFYQNMRHSNAGNVWGVQVAWGWSDNANRLRTRNVTSNTFGSWVNYWNDSNDGEGSGLDADLLDGVSWGNVNTTIKTTGDMIINNGSPTLFLQDTDQNSAAIHVNSNIFYILRGGVNTTTITQVNSVWPLEINLTNNNATFGGNVNAPTVQISGNTVIDSHRRFFGNTTTRSFFAAGAGNITTTGSDNNFIGNQAGQCNTTGSDNNFFGNQAGCCNTTGSDNNFFGPSAGRCNTTGSCNNFFGALAGYNNTTGSHNNFFGHLVGYNNTTGSHNNFFGHLVGYNNTTGCNNNFFGRIAGCSNTTGSHNNFIGNQAGQFNTTGSDNNFFGPSAGRCNTTGSDNNFFGALAGSANTTGSDNNFFGALAGSANTTGSYNNFFGALAGYNNTTGCNNNFFGALAGYNNTTGSHNNFFGNQAGYNNTTGCNNNFFGALAGQFNTTGSDNNFIGNQAGCCNTTGSDNNFFGPSAGRCNTTGSCNNFIGRIAGRANTTGCNNNFIGAIAGRSNTTGSYNNFFGTCAGFEHTTGNNNNFFGFRAGDNNTTASNNIAIGQHAGTTGLTPSGLINFTTTGNQIVMGNASHTVACIQIAWTTVSDIRYKCVWGNVSHGRDFLRNVTPIKYSFIDHETQEVTDTHKRYGFSAQEVLALEGEDPVIVSDKNPDNLGMNYEYMIPVLVNAIKELDAENKSILARLEALENAI